MAARRTPASRPAAAVFFKPAPRHLWLAMLGLMAAVKRRLPGRIERGGKPQR